MEEGKVSWKGDFIFLLIAIFLISVLLLLVDCIFLEKLEKPEFDVTTVSIGQPELDIEPVRFYLVEGQWNYALVRFKDTGIDGELDKVFCSYSRVPVDLDKFNPGEEFSADRIFDPNSSFSEWNGWIQRFEETLQEHEKKLKFQEQRQLQLRQARERSKK